MANFDFEKYFDEFCEGNEDGEYFRELLFIEETEVGYNSGSGERLSVPPITSKVEADWFLYFIGLADKPI